MIFYLGTHMANWLRFSPIPLFVSDTRLRKYKTLPVARSRWALDSGGFTELSRRGRWVAGAEEYARRARRYQLEVGRLDFAAPQDWMCEEAIIEGGVLPGGIVAPGTGLSVHEHQVRTIDSYVELRALEPGVPWAPALQGQQPADYLRHVAMYAARGIDLGALPVVLVGSVCRLQATRAAADIFNALRQEAGLSNLHGLGVKSGASAYPGVLQSADSTAWSIDARHKPPLPQCVGKHINCANCWDAAERWYLRLLPQIGATA